MHLELLFPFRNIDLGLQMAKSAWRRGPEAFRNIFGLVSRSVICILPLPILLPSFTCFIISPVARIPEEAQRHLSHGPLANQ